MSDPLKISKVVCVCGRGWRDIIILWQEFLILIEQRAEALNFTFKNKQLQK